MNNVDSDVIGSKKAITGMHKVEDNVPIVLMPENTYKKTFLKSVKNCTYLALKRLIDIIGGICGTVFLIPLTIVICIANKLVKDNGPIFYMQDRIGKNGKTFKMVKYRSMVVGADEKLEEYLAENEEAREEYRINRKLKNDPRITKVGSFIRKTSIDEFPQFINVLKGEMSLVGPRPYLPNEKQDMGKTYNCIIESKPGLTGFWQVNGRNDVTFQDRLNMDFDYYGKRSLKLDLKLLCLTVKKVLKREGAA